MSKNDRKRFELFIESNVRKTKLATKFNIVICFKFNIRKCHEIILNYLFAYKYLQPFSAESLTSKEIP